VHAPQPLSPETHGAETHGAETHGAGPATAGLRWNDGLWLAALRLLVSAVVWLGGFRAISDDDFARVVIAQRFAISPSWDPSGSSWLPFPFWLQGFAMLGFGPSLECAQTVALLSGVLSTLLVWFSASLVGLNRGQACLAAALASVFPYAARLGVATVPEQLTSALTIVGVTSLAQGKLRWRLVGSVALLLGSLSRYETWPVAAAFSLWCALQAQRNRRARLLAPAAIASLGMLLWLLHGHLNHDNPLFFVKRVTDYRAALDGATHSWWWALVRHPLLLIRHEPELSLLGLGSVLLLWRAGPRAQLEQLRKPFTLLAVLLLFLISGDLRGAGATHHPERALLPIWTFAALVIAGGAATAWRWLTHQRARPRPVPRLFAALGVIACVGLARPLIGAQVHFVDRTNEVALGRAASTVAKGERLLIVTDDYSYFAMIAGFADPTRAEPFDTQDPRMARMGDPFASPQRFLEQLRTRRVRALIAPEQKLAQAEAIGRIEYRRGKYAVVNVPPGL
jgi:hypothetical protein